MKNHKLDNAEKKACCLEGKSQAPGGLKKPAALRATGPLSINRWVSQYSLREGSQTNQESG